MPNLKVKQKPVLSQEQKRDKLLLSTGVDLDKVSAVFGKDTAMNQVLKKTFNCSLIPTKDNQLAIDLNKMMLNGEISKELTDEITQYLKIDKSNNNKNSKNS